MSGSGFAFAYVFKVFSARFTRGELQVLYNTHERHLLL